MTTTFEDLPYRPCAGIMLANMQGKIFVGQRLDRPEGTDAWQMPQGGIDDGEDAENNAHLLVDEVEQFLRDQGTN